MTTYNAAAVADSVIAHKKGITLQTGRALRDNPIALAEGATGAPRIQLGALAELVAGGSQRAVGPALSDTTNTIAPTEVCRLALIQRGTIRVYAEHRVTGGSMSSDLYVDLLRAGSVTNLGTWNTASTTFVARTLDATVKPGDAIRISHLAIGITPTSEVQSPQFSTDGGDLWPIYTGSVAVVNNSV
jgi:hypothetical protein